MDQGEQQPQPTANGDRAEWIVPVRDAVLGRPLELIIAATEGRVAVAPPTSGGYIVPPESISRYCDALRSANNVAAHQRLLAGMDRER